MTAEIFLDTNILVYAFSKHPSELQKARTARELMEKGGFGTSTQVMQEFYVTATRKMAQPLMDQQAVEFLGLLSQLPLVEVDYDVILKAIQLKNQFRISYWDAAILAAAQELESEILYTEDLNHNQRYGQLRVFNPFLAH